MVGGADPAGAVCAAFVAATPCDGAAFTVMSSESVRELWCASDPVIARVASVQFALGEGPALEAFTTSRPVLIADLGSADAMARWPTFTAETAELQIGGLFVFPMHLGALTLGVCELYRRTTGQLSVPELGSVLRALDIRTLSLLSLRAGETVADHEANDHEANNADGSIDGVGGDGVGAAGGGVLGGWQVHQATGMLIAQLGVGAEMAFARLRAHAYADGKDMLVIAEDIIARRLRLEPDPSPGVVES